MRVRSEGGKRVIERVEIERDLRGGGEEREKERRGKLR